MAFELLFLGTGAADFSDKLESSCADSFDPDARRSSSVLLNNHVLIDCGPHVLHALHIAGKAYEGITDLIVSHFHSDHFDLKSVEMLAKSKKSALNLWCRAGAELPSISNCTVHEMKLFSPNNIAEFQVTGFPANHQKFPQHLSVEKDGKRMFYGLDGAWFLGDTVRYMQNKNYDLFIFDSTVGDYAGDYRIGEHNSIPMLRLLVPSMRTLHILNEKSRILLSHIAPTLHKMPHNKICEIAAEQGWEVAYDGLKITV